VLEYVANRGSIYQSIGHQLILFIKRPTSIQRRETFVIAVFFLLSVIVFSNNFAQDISKLRVVNKPELIPGELIEKSNRDNNGDVCSGLIVISDLTGLNYQSSNGIVKINRSAGKDFLFLSPEERVFEIFCSGFEPLKIILNEFNIKLHSGEVWQIKITGDKKLDLIPINIITGHDENEVFIDNISKGKGTTFETSQGEHSIRIEMKGYQTIVSKINVSTKNILFPFTPRQIDQEKVEIRSEPKGAEFVFNGISEGITDAQIFRYPGRYKVKLTKSGYSDFEEEIEVKEGAANKFNFTLIKNVATLKLILSPGDIKGINIEINKKRYDGNQDIELSPGSHLIVITKDGYREVRETIVLESNQTITKTIKLEPITGNLQVSVTPIDAEVKLMRNGDKIRQWNGAEIVKDLLIGNYTIEAVFDGYKKVARAVQITEGKRTVEEIKLEKSAEAKLNPDGKDASDKLSKNYENLSIPPGQLMDIANNYFRNKNNEQAIKFYQAKINSDPAYEPAYRYMGFAYMGLEKYNDARSAFVKARSLADTTFETYYWLAQCYVRLDSVSKAASQYETVLRLAEGKESRDKVKITEAADFLGRQAYSSKNYEGVIKYTLKAVQLKPSEWRYMELLGVCYNQIGNNGEAVKWYKAALKANPKDEVAKKGLRRLSAD